MYKIFSSLCIVIFTATASLSYAAGVPSNAVMFFAQKTCPNGWVAYTDARGRAIVGIVPSLSGLPKPGSTLAGTVGTPLRNRENRQHAHNVNPAAQTTSSTAVPHTHNMNHGHGQIIGGAHRHQWIHSNPNGSWISYTQSGSEDLMSYEHELDPSSNTNRFAVWGIENSSWYTDSAAHYHEIPVGNFTTSGATPTSHTHSVDIPATSTDVKRTGDVMPYIQLTVCIKS